MYMLLSHIQRIEKDFYCTKKRHCAIKVLLLQSVSRFIWTVPGLFAVMTSTDNGFPRKLLPLISAYFTMTIPRKQVVFTFFQYPPFFQKHTVQEIFFCPFFSSYIFGMIRKTKNTPKGGNIDET